MKDAVHLVHLDALREGALLYRVRREFAPSGVDPVSSLVKTFKVGPYSMHRPVSAHETMRASDIAEPPEDSPSVDMLSALDDRESAFYRDEANVTDFVGKSEVIFRELELQYGFIGGSDEEYLKYHSRPDVRYLWEWQTGDTFKAVAGMSTVPKKQAPQQRKLLMQCATNYMWCSGKHRGNHGMLGGGALSRLYIPSDRIEISCFDESNAFTAVVTPSWMWSWC